MVVPDFSNFEFKPIGAGELNIIPGFSKIQFDFEEGYCLRQSLKKIGVYNELPIWSNVNAALKLTDRIVAISEREIVFYMDKIQPNM